MAVDPTLIADLNGPRFLQRADIDRVLDVLDELSTFFAAEDFLLAFRNPEMKPGSGYRLVNDERDHLAMLRDSVVSGPYDRFIKDHQPILNPGAKFLNCTNTDCQHPTPEEWNLHLRCWESTGTKLPTRAD